MDHPILTVPKECEEYKPCYLTGNEYISFPEILPETGGILSLNVLHMAACGLLEFCGEKGKPLVEPLLRVNGRDYGSGGLSLRWFYRNDWEPSFSAGTKKWKLHGSIIAPPGHRGGIYVLSFKNMGTETLKVEMGWRGRWSSINRIVFSRKCLHEKRYLSFDRWTKSLVMETRSGIPLASLALSSSAGNTWSYTPTAQKSSFTYSNASHLLLKPGETHSVALFMAVNLDGDGAAATTVDFRRMGWRKLGEENRKWLREHCCSFHEPVLPVLTGMLNHNLFFNYFFALGRAIDTDQLVSVTSRSPRYYVSAAFWSRDALLWSFPAFLMVDRDKARELLLIVFTRHLKRAGEHAHYINGSLLYPGFELDQLCAYFLSLSRYLKVSGDYSILHEKCIQNGLEVLVKKLVQQHDFQTGLYSTFLDPSDDPVQYPFLIYDNALAWCALNFLTVLKEKELWGAEMKNELSKRSLSELTAQLKEAIYKHGVVNGPFGRMFAWSVNGQGKYQLYDNPPGSLQLLAYYGFCKENDEVFINTVKWIRSRHNPYFHTKGPLAEAGSLHAGNPWPLSAANDLLALNKGAFDFLSRVRMDNGLACETVHPVKGDASTGLAFASAAGFLAHAIWWRINGKERSSDRFFT